MFMESWILRIPCKESKGAKIRNRYNQVAHLTQDTEGESDKLTVIHHKREPIGQPFPSRWPQGTNKQAHTKIHKRSTALERSVKFYWRA